MLLKNNLCIFFGIFLVSMILVPNISAQEVTIPDWIKNNAGWWAGGLIDDNSFVSGLQWLISNGIIMLELEVNNQDPDEEGRFAGGILTGENCNTEIDKDGDKVPDNLDVEGSIDWSHCTMEGRDLSNRDLSGANLSGANLYGAELDNTNLSGADLSYTVLYKASLANTVFTGANLSYANMCGATNPVVKGTSSSLWPGGTYHEPKYLIFDFTDTDMSYADFDHAQMQYVILTDAIVKHTNFHDANLEGVDLSYKDLTGTILTETNLTGANLAGVDLSGRDLTGTILKGVDLSNKDLTGTILKGADLTGAVLPNDYSLSEKNFQKTVFDGNNLSGKNLYASSLWSASFKNANLKNTNLSYADLRASDLTEIKNKSLAGSDLSNTSFLLANLSGVNLTNVILDGTNFWKTDLSGVDFTVTSKKSYHGTIFKEANLSNSNFEGVSLSPKQVFSSEFKNVEKDVIEGEHSDGLSLFRNLGFMGYIDDVGYIGLENIHIISTEVHGDDLIVKFVFFNNFAHANLENASFKNTGLWFVDFNSANLTNADLSGADLRNSSLNNADLSNANLQGVDLSGTDLSGTDLSGANLSDVIYDQNTILKCVNHDICG